MGRRAGVREELRPADEGPITDATVALLREGEPFAERSVEQIASRAENPRTAFYDYFRDKRDLVIRMAEAAAAPVVREADELVDALVAIAVRAVYGPASESEGSWTSS